MSVEAFLSQLRARGVQLWLDGERLCFRAPPGCVTPALRAEVARWRAQMVGFLRESGQWQAAPHPSGPRPPQAAAPLSFAQARLWFLEQLAPGTAAYNIPLLLRLRGALDTIALQAAFEGVLTRHQVLRMAVRNVDGGPEPYCLSATARAGMLDLEDQADAEAWAQAAVLAISEAPFDLAAGPLYRLQLVRLAAREHLCLLVLHHIVFDAWSAEVLMRELSELYAAHLGGRPGRLAPLPLSYFDYAYWQQRACHGARHEADCAFWRAAMADAPPALELPGALRRHGLPSGTGAEVRFAVPASTATALKAYAAARGCTSYMLLLASLAQLLSRCGGQADLVIGSPVANRSSEQLAGLIGLFVNTIPLRIDLRGARGFEQSLLRVRDVVLAASAHQELPLEKIVELSGAARNLGYSPLFQVLFAYGVPDGAALKLDGLEVRYEQLPRRTAKFDLTLWMSEQDDGWDGGFEYSLDRFEPAMVAGLAQQLCEQLEQLGRGPAGVPAPLPRPVPASAPGLLHARFEDQAAHCPKRVAVRTSTGSMTYAELDVAAGRLARRLRELGAVPDSRIGVCMGRTSALLVALLGVLKAGAAYVPLDPQYPAAYREFVLGDAAVAFVLCDEAGASLAPPGSAWWSVAALLALPDAGAEPAAARGPVPHNLAYILYTSGSTGVPKGVAISHASARHMLEWAAAAYDSAELVGVLAATSICFDLSVFELFAALGCGGCVVLVENLLQLAGAQVPDGITLVNTVPSVLAALLEHASLPRSVRTVNLAGEALHAGLVAAAYAQPGVRRVCNLYGPSEVATYATAAGLARGAAQPPPIGTALPHVDAYVLDMHGEPVPDGMIGELYLAGPALARGYLGRPALTAGAFLPDPRRDGERMYRTGDLVRRRADGNLLYLGRRDHQVKLRGFRIELAEIDSVLAQHPSVRAAAVLLVDGGPRGLEVAAFVALRDGPAALAAVRQWLAGRLPAHMQPAIYTVLPALPLNASGKIDRIALASMERAPAQAPAPAAACAVEQALLEVWQRVLGRTAIGIDENFFEAGGHSLALLQVRAGIAEHLGCDVALVDLFRFPTIRMLARHCGAGAPTADDGAAQAARRAARRRRALASPTTSYGSHHADE